MHNNVRRAPSFPVIFLNLRERFFRRPAIRVKRQPFYKYFKRVVTGKNKGERNKKNPGRSCFIPVLVIGLAELRPFFYFWIRQFSYSGLVAPVNNRGFFIIFIQNISKFSNSGWHSYAGFFYGQKKCLQVGGMWDEKPLLFF